MNKAREEVDALLDRSNIAIDNSFFYRKGSALFIFHKLNDLDKTNAILSNDSSPICRFIDEIVPQFTEKVTYLYSDAPFDRSPLG